MINDKTQISMHNNYIHSVTLKILYRISLKSTVVFLIIMYILKNKKKTLQF